MTLLEEVVDTSPRLSARTKQVYLQAIRRFLRAAGEDPSGWTMAAAQQFYNQLLIPRRGTEVKPQTANGVMYALRYAGSRLAKAHPARDFAADVELRREDAPRTTRALSRQDAIELLESCSSKNPRDLRDRAIVGLCLRTGMRRSSLCGITFADVTRESVTIRLKGGRRHAVPITASIAQDVDPWRAWLRRSGVEEGPLFRSLRAVIDSDSLSVGERLTENGLYAILARRRQHLTSGHQLNPHSFRHTFVTWCQERGVPTHAIVAITGHQIERGASIVDRTYTDHTIAGARAIDAIDAYLREGPLVTQVPNGGSDA